MTETKPYLLLAEDDAKTAEVVGDLAESLGWRVHRVADGTQAWEAFSAAEPDMVLLDYYMPGLDGFEVLERVRGAKSQVPVIIMTAASEETTVLEALRLGATDFLRKPFEHLLLLRTILRRENKRHQTRHIQQLVSTRVVSHSIEFDIENDLAIASGVCAYIAETLIHGDSVYAIRLGLEELCANAIEHGNLGFDGEQKARALESNTGAWDAMLRQRAAQPEYASRRVRILASVDGDMFEVMIQDQGAGFDPNQTPDPLAEENMFRPNGRGLFLARQQFDELKFLGRGNIARARKRLG